MPRFLRAIVTVCALVLAGVSAFPGGSAARHDAAPPRTDVYGLVASGSAAPTPSPAGAGLLAAAASASQGKGKGAGWKVGFAKELLDPRPDELLNVRLGGYGIGPESASTGPMVDTDGTVEHIYARAMAVTNKHGQALLLAALENQGTFAAYKQGPYGIWDIRQQVSHDTGVPVDSIVVNSDHSHAGPDLIGLWGGVPVSYLKYVHDEAVKALDEAFAARRDADLTVGTNEPAMPDGELFDHSQFPPDSANNYPDDRVDTQLRVLQAYDEDTGAPLGTLINYAAHATVTDSGNLLYSADWPGRVARATEQALSEPVAVTMVADVGRTQPPRPSSVDGSDADKLDTWTRLFTPWVVAAVGKAVPVTGTTIASKEVFTREQGTNGALLGVSYTGEAPVNGFGAYRSVTPPWLTGGVIGTFVSAHRIGDVLFTASPGEAYPDIRFALLTGVKNVQAAFTFGLANDQLGYLIAPASEYPWITANPFTLGNDNAFFNVSAQYGDHIYCTQLAETAAIGFATAPSAAPYGPDAVSPNCGLVAASDAAPMGPAPQQPWPFGDGVTPVQQPGR